MTLQTKAQVLAILMLGLATACGDDSGGGGTAGTTGGTSGMTGGSSGKGSSGTTSTGGTTASTGGKGGSSGASTGGTSATAGSSAGAGGSKAGAGGSSTAGSSAGAGGSKAGAGGSSAGAGGAGAEPTCAKYCSLAVGMMCTGTLKVYDDAAACMTGCGMIATKGTVNDMAGNTLGCRIYHLTVANSSAAMAMTHCKHGLVMSDVCK